MKQRQELMRYHHALGEMRAAIDVIEHAPAVDAELSNRLRKASALISGGAIALNSALRLSLPDEVGAGE